MAAEKEAADTRVGPKKKQEHSVLHWEVEGLAAAAVAAAAAEQTMPMSAEMTAAEMTLEVAATAEMTAAAAAEQTMLTSDE